MKRYLTLSLIPMLAVLVLGGASIATGQLPLGPARNSGQTITPAYEGWYANPDGTINLSWGYFNRNAEEPLDIPVGARNQMSPGGPDLGQPTHFLPGRHRGVFVVTVPADFGDNEINWTIDFRDTSVSIPSHTHRDWVLDAVNGAASGNTPPKIGFGSSMPESQGPRGATTGPLTVGVGQPLEVSVGVSDDGLTRRNLSQQREIEEEERPQITLSWSKYRGPGQVSFDESDIEVMELTGTATTTATFAEPGDYIVHALVTDIDGVSGNQCCWTNAFVKIAVTP